MTHEDALMLIRAVAAIAVVLTFHVVSSFISRMFHK